MTVAEQYEAIARVCTNLMMAPDTWAGADPPTRRAWLKIARDGLDELFAAVEADNRRHLADSHTRRGPTYKGMRMPK